MTASPKNTQPIDIGSRLEPLQGWPPWESRGGRPLWRGLGRSPRFHCRAGGRDIKGLCCYGSGSGVSI